MEKEREEEADERREAAIASAATLRPNFKPRSGLTHAHLSKFQELHKRRLQIKAKSKVHKRDKGIWKGKSHKKTIEVDDGTDQEPSKTVVDASNKEDNVAGGSAAKIRQKLHWGLDTKERWERKSNM